LPGQSQLQTSPGMQLSAKGSDSGEHALAAISIITNKTFEPELRTPNPSRVRTTFLTVAHLRSTLPIALASKVFSAA
jgi:hypothetical protein